MRMSLQGEWGDHMMLIAISNVVGRKLVIYNSEVSRGQTTMEPNGGVRHEGVLYISHVGQSHFVSMRPEGWRTSWYQSELCLNVLACSFFNGDFG